MVNERISSPSERPAGMLCPACKVDLVLSERQGIEIDYCPQCRGVWLDRGELDKIIERNMAYQKDMAPPQPGPSGMVAPGYGQPGPWGGGYEGHHGSHHGGHHGGGHHGGFLGGLFRR